MHLPEIVLSKPEGKAGAPLVVLGHSLGTGPLIWEQTVKPLQKNFRVSLLSLPGHSDAPVATHPFTLEDIADSLIEAVTRFTPEKFLYAGVSIGGALALVLALRHPAHLLGVASVASAASLGSPSHWHNRAATVREQSTSVLVAPSSKTWFSADSYAKEPELIGRILRTLQEVSSEGYAQCAEALANYDVRESLPQITIPVLAMGGQLDEVAPEERQDEIVASVAGARKVIIEGVAHQPPAERSDMVANELNNFFSEVSSARK